MKEMCSFSIYSEMKFLWKLHCNLNLKSSFFAALIHGAEVIAALQFCDYWLVSVVDPICDFIRIKAFFLAVKICDFQGLSVKTENYPANV